MTEQHKELLKRIRTLRASIRARRKTILYHFACLKRDIAELASHLCELERAHRSRYTETLAKTFGPAAIAECKLARFLARRGTVDKHFLQELGLLPKPPAKRPKKNRKPSPLLRKARLEAELRKLQKENPDL